LFLNRATLVSQASSKNGNTNGNLISNSKKVEVVDQMQQKVNELCTKIDELQRELDLKSGTIDRKFFDFIFILYVLFVYQHLPTINELEIRLFIFHLFSVFIQWFTDGHFEK
jgi:hypothetical protein